MQWFAERFSGWIIRIGPDAGKRPDPYIWALPLSDTGEFVGVSTNCLNSEAVRVAIEAAGTLGFEEPRWQHKEKITMGHDHNFKHKHQIVEDKHKSDGSIDPETGKKNVAAYAAAVANGSVVVLAVGDPVPVPGMPGVVGTLIISKQ